MMNSTGYPDLDGYLSRVAWRLTLIEGHLRRDILEELARHILDRASDGGADVATRAAVSRSLSGAKDPSEVACQYRDLYGWGRPQRTLALVAVMGRLGSRSRWS